TAGAAGAGASSLGPRTLASRFQSRSTGAGRCRCFSCPLARPFPLPGSAAARVARTTIEAAGKSDLAFMAKLLEDRPKARPWAPTKQPECRARNERATALFLRLRGRMSPANVLGGGRMLERLTLWADAHTPNAIRVAFILVLAWLVSR